MNLNLRNLRGDRTQQEIADAIGITKSHYGFIENGNRSPSLPVALRIADYFHVSLDEVFNQKRQNPPKTIMQK